MEELNFEDLWEYFKSKIIIFSIIVFLCLLASILYTFVFQVPTYESTATMVLTMSNDTEGGITQNDLVINEKLVATYSEIMKSKRVLNQVTDNLDLDESYNQVGEYISVTNKSDTELINISVVHEDKSVAKDLANEIADVFMEEIVEIYSIENINVIDYADKSKNPNNVNVSLQIGLGAISGVGLSMLLIISLYFVDNTIKSVEEVERKTGMTIIGLVPMKKGGKK